MKVIEITLPNGNMTKAFYWDKHISPTLNYSTRHLNCTSNHMIVVTEELKVRIDESIQKDQPLLLTQEEAG